VNIATLFLINLKNFKSRVDNKRISAIINKGVLKMPLFNSKITHNIDNAEQKSKPKNKINSPRKVSPFFKISQKLENLANNFWPVAYLYFLFIYKKKLEREISMAQLEPGKTVLHIGCGPCPYTAIFLAERGMQVTAVDNDESAANKAKQLVKRKNLENYISINCEDGKSLNGNKFDAVWVSLNVQPKEKILQEGLGSLNDKGVLIYRNVPRWLSSYFITVPPAKWPSSYHTETRLSRMGAESVMVKKKL